MSECGYIKLHRKSLDSRVFQNDGMWRLWTWCLLRANFKEGWISVKTGKGESQVKILPGQFVFGRKSAAKELKENPETIRKRMDKLKNIGNITIESTSQYSIITIINWDSYQGCENKSTTESTSQVPAKYQPSTTIEEGKEGKEGKEKRFSSDSDEVRLSEMLLGFIRQRDQKFKQPNIQRWAKNIDLMMRVDKRESMEIEKVICWCQTDNFWQNNILSTSILREKYSKLFLQSGITKQADTPWYLQPEQVQI